MHASSVERRRRSDSFRSWPIGALAGMAGGITEVVWIVFYAYLTGGAADTVAQGVTATVFPALAMSSHAVPLGIGIHMALAVVLGIAVATLLPALLPRLTGTLVEPILIVAILVGIWTVNFFVVLPALNPTFVGLLPLGTTLASKVLFGLAAGLFVRVYRTLSPVGAVLANIAPVQPRTTNRKGTWS